MDVADLRGDIFFDLSSRTINGPSAMVPGGKQNVSAMPIGVLEEAFSRPFLKESEGGCPALR